MIPKTTLTFTLVVLTAGPAFAWDSKCYRSDGSTCSDGPGQARNRWVGEYDEHRQIWLHACGMAGLPALLCADSTVDLKVFTSDHKIEVDDEEVSSLVPVPFDEAVEVQTRSFSIAEITQLPDFSHSIWDWATGNEWCPLESTSISLETPGGAENREACHSFKTHMGPVNSSHFLPQAERFYKHLHKLAMNRARECKALAEAIEGFDETEYPALLRAQSVVRDCELQAMFIEAAAQHFLADAWSLGHMWERWGAPDLEDFPEGGPFSLTPGDLFTNKRATAAIVAVTSGLIHGSRGVLQEIVDEMPSWMSWTDWASYDVNDALCAPADGVDSTYSDSYSSDPLAAVGDMYLNEVLASATDFDSIYKDQYESFFSCAASSMRDVYEATGMLLGETDIFAEGLDGILRRDPESDACFAQRATNRAIYAGIGVHYRDEDGKQHYEPLTSWAATKLIVTLGTILGGDLPLGLLPGSINDARYRRDMGLLVSIAELKAKDSPDGIELATGGLGELLGVKPNGDYATGTTDSGLPEPLAEYQDPDLPWPATDDAITSSAVERATVLARVFHHAHAADWCFELAASDLDALKSSSPPEDAQGRAKCDICVEFAKRHLRIGTGPTDYDEEKEPLCYLFAQDPTLNPNGVSPEYLYEETGVAEAPAALARVWCGCGEECEYNGQCDFPAEVCDDNVCVPCPVVCEYICCPAGTTCPAPGVDPICSP